MGEPPEHTTLHAALERGAALRPRLSVQVGAPIRDEDGVAPLQACEHTAVTGVGVYEVVAARPDVQGEHAQGAGDVGPGVDLAVDEVDIDRDAEPLERARL